MAMKMKIKITLFLILLFQFSNAQQTFDVFTFKSPEKWNVSEKENSIIFSTVNESKGTWAQIDIIKSTTSKGNILDDFESEWKSLVIDRYGVTGQPIMIDTQTFQGWKVRTGLGKFFFNKDTASLLLNTFSNGTRCASFILVSNTTSYGTIMDEFLGTVAINSDSKPALTNAGNVDSKNNGSMNSNGSSAILNDGFTFNTTNFEDGWTSVVKEDWVESTKGNIRVLLHYPREEDKKYYSQYKEHVSTFWNLLVAPRYSNLREYQSPDHLLSWQPGLFAAGLLTDKATGRDVWVALFSKGKSGWVEVITPDKKTFVENFGVDQPQLYFDEWGKMLNLFGLNKFAVGENDLIGKWSDNFYGSTAYYSTVTGLYAGSTTFASSTQFIFNKNKTFSWELGMGQSGINTTMKVDHAKASGNWKLLNNWQIWFSEIERSPKTYNAYFTCIKGGRVLWLQDISYGSYTAYGKVSK